MIKIKRIYEPASKGDGYRVLVDRLWPRGVSKEKSALDLWMKDIAPSDGLRKWFDHDPAKWKEFISKYKEELESKIVFIQELKELAKDHKSLTLLYAAHDEKHNHAIVLKEFLDAQN